MKEFLSHPELFSLVPSYHSQDGLKELIEWITEIENSVFALSAPEIELKMLAQFKEKANSLLLKQ